jgi:hypothetical protein
VRIKYKLGSTPIVHVVHPPLEWMGNKDPPHRYNDGSLCLFLPQKGEWRADMLIATTTVPWASEWLAHYEIWLACGQWRGGGADH